MLSSKIRCELLYKFNLFRCSKKLYVSYRLFNLFCYFIQTWMVVCS